MSKNLRIGILTNIPTPYRKAMCEAYSKIENMAFDIFYFSKMHKDRKWNFDKAAGVNEVFLDGIHLGKLNLEIFSLAKKYDLWIIGGYSESTVQLSILLCKVLRIPYVIMFDGISPEKIDARENKLKFSWKKFLVKGCFAFLGNGTVGKLYRTMSLKNFYNPIDSPYYFYHLQHF